MHHAFAKDRGNFSHGMRITYAHTRATKRNGTDNDTNQRLLPIRSTTTTTPSTPTTTFGQCMCIGMQVCTSEELGSGAKG